MKKEIKIEVGDKITFKQYGELYTKKVKEVVTGKYHDRISYNVNPIGSGTGYLGIEHAYVISVRKQNKI